MNRIVALNDTDSDNSEDEDDLQVTKEAEEAIAVSEYMRALNFKKENKIEDALILFHGLLNTQILHEITSENKDNKLFFVKYNCYKNIGFIYMDQKDNEKALDHMLSAYELDDTDVFAMNKLGQLSLSMGKLQTAIIVFEKCLKQNPNHWPAGDGILQALCLQQHYTEAYGWALEWYTKDNGYKRGLDVILEIREKFNKSFDYIENSWKIKFTDTHLKRTNTQSMFPLYSCHEPEPILKPDLTEFRIEELTWHSIGHLITSFFEKHHEDMSAICNNYLLDDFYGTIDIGNEPGAANSVAIENGSQKSPDSLIDDRDLPPSTEPATINCDDIQANNVGIQSTDNSSNSNCDGKFVTPLSGDVRSSAEQSGADDSETSTKPIGDASSTTEQTTKPKPVRRRCSDLSFLEQWGWHKHRRYQHRKKSIDRNEPDTSLNGILRRILAKYFKENFDNENPLIPEQIDKNSAENSHENVSEKAECKITLEQFQVDTADDFQQFINELKSRPFDLTRLVLKWTEYIAKFWHRKIPSELLDIYLNIYPYYLKHHDITAWNLLSSLEINAVYDMMLFYVELYHDKALSVAKQGVKNECDSQWFKLYNHLCLLLGFYSFEENTKERFEKCRKRIYWLQYSLATYEYDLSEAMNYLEVISHQMINDNQQNFVLKLPNSKHNSHLDLATIDSIKISLQRAISINNVKSLYENEKYSDLADILIDNLTNSMKKINSTVQSNDLFTISLKFSTQFEVLLEALWMTEHYEQCTIWSERCLKYSLDKFVESPAHRQTEWAENVTFILTYIEALIMQESISITDCLGNYFSRLIQSITRVVVHQLDAPFDKNNNRLHAINTKYPWVILHHVIQREETRNYVASKKCSSAVATTNGSVGVGTIISSTGGGDREELIDDAMPCSIMIFFTAHEHLGLRSWCTKHDSQLLLYTLDIVATRLRSPYLEPYRDVIAEYLEQVTYCLYGYPAKRVRARHIEEHDATNVDLTWDRAVQLFDLYRPDNLPEFNSYKNDSISADMEQLLQRIVNLIPMENDPSSHTTGIEEYIDGKTTELPEPINCLPYRIQCIFYLLADYYFKTRDFAKSIKYYIMDLAICPTRFDSWAGLALSKTSKMETKLNSCGQLDKNEFLIESEDVLRCFRQCIELDKKQVPLWIEYGNFAYAVHSYYSRSLKQSSATLSMERFAFMEEKKDQCLKIASDCFTTVEQSTIRPNDDDPDSHDEKWLYHYMLGKIAEKRKEQPEMFIDHYIKASRCLYENNASYPFRICHSNPQNLSIEALEVYYRITSSIIKYIEQHSTITRATGKYFIKILKDVGGSPFAMNQAKIDDSIGLKRKLPTVNEQDGAADNAPKHLKIDKEPAVMDVVEPVDQLAGDVVEQVMTTTVDEAPVQQPTQSVSPSIVANIPQVIAPPVDMITDIVTTNNDPKISSPIRRGSQESAATTATTTTTATGSDSTSTSSSASDTSSNDSSSSDSDSDSSDDGPDKATKPLKEHDLESIFKTCIRNLEECVTRFPEHYKSIYRLVNIYLNAPDAIKDLRKCKQLLLSTYTTGLNNSVQGLFADRKNNNFFNGIWRIPSTEIDRPGSFSAHLSKCIIILMEVLRLSCDHRILLEFGLQIQRNPDMDKRYIKDLERKELFQQAISFCIQSFRNLLVKHSREQRDDKELISLLIEIYKAHKKSMKYLLHKEALFSTLLVDVYKVFMEGRLNRMPDSAIGAADYVIRMCQQELVARTNQEKNGGAFAPGPLTLSLYNTNLLMSSTATSTVPIDMVMHNKMFTSNEFSTNPLNPSTTSAYFAPQNVSTTVQSNMSTSSPIFTSMITTPITSISTNTSSTMGMSSATTIPSSSAASAATVLQSSSSYISGASRPRGRPPGSKNSNMTTNLSAAAASAASNPFLSRLDPAMMAAMMGMYNNPNLMSSMAMPSNYSDPNTVNSLLNEYMKFAGMSSLLGNMQMQPGAFIPSTSSSLSPNISSTTIAKTTSSIDSSISAIAMASNKSTASTVISLGSGQLTITPTLSTAPSASTSLPTKQTKEYIPNTFNNAYLAMLQAEADSRLNSSHIISAKSSKYDSKSQSAISVTKVPQQKSSPIPSSSSTIQSNNLNFPKSLPKSLTIIPTPAGYSGKSQLSNQAPQITLQPEKLLPPAKSSNDKQKKKSQQKPVPAAAPLISPFGEYVLQDYNQQMAILNQYSEMIKGISASRSMTDISKSTQPATSRSNKTKHSKSLSSKDSASSITAVKQMQQLAAAGSFSGNSGGGGGSSATVAAPLAHQQKPTKSYSVSCTTTTQKIHQSSPSPKMNSYSPLPPFVIPSSTPPILSSPSPNKSPIMHSGLTVGTAGSGNAGGHQISPTKTLQQKLAERQKALMDANKAETSRAAAEKSSRQVSEVINID